MGVSDVPCYRIALFYQTHLVKDFKNFSGSVPAAFLKQTPLTEQEYICRVEKTQNRRVFTIF